MIVGIHQPNYFPGISYFAKILLSDIFVLLDSVQYTKGNWTNRNRIKSSQGAQFLTVPILSKGKMGQCISEVIINDNVNWRNRQLKTITQNYGKSRYYDEYKTMIEEMIKFNISYLSALNIRNIKQLLALIGIKTKIIIASELEDTKLTSTHLLVHLVKTVGGTAYISGAGGRRYMETEQFSKANLEIMFTEFNPVPYRQNYGDFIPNLSIIDLLLNEGPNSLDIITKCAKISR